MVIWKLYALPSVGGSASAPLRIGLHEELDALEALVADECRKQSWYLSWATLCIRRYSTFSFQLLRASSVIWFSRQSLCTVACN